jgi:hypothetical protein
MENHHKILDEHQHDDMLDRDLGFGRIVALEIDALNMFANRV